MKKQKRNVRNLSGPSKKNLHAYIYICVCVQEREREREKCHLTLSALTKIIVWLLNIKKQKIFKTLKIHNLMPNIV